jgi:iron complex outermembrane receptor protein
MSYLDFKYTSLSAAARASGISLDMTTPFAPKWKYSAGVQYQIPLGTFGSVTPRVDGSYQSAFNGQAVNSFFNRVPGYKLVNSRVTWRSGDKNWDVALEVTNLTNELYYLGYFDNQGSTQNTLGQIAPPRQWAVSVKRQFQ